MTYELAKQLKDAGFPTPKGADEEWDTYDRMFPTLSELIDACLPDFKQLSYYRMDLAQVSNKWGAFTESNLYAWLYRTITLNDICLEGKAVFVNGGWKILTGNLKHVT